MQESGLWGTGVLRRTEEGTGGLLWPIPWSRGHLATTGPSGHPDPSHSASHEAVQPRSLKGTQTAHHQVASLPEGPAEPQPGHEIGASLLVRHPTQKRKGPVLTRWGCRGRW